MPPTRFQVRAREKIDTPDTLKRYFDEWNEEKTMLSAEGEKEGCTKESLLRNRAATIFSKRRYAPCVVRAAHIVLSSLPYSCPTKIYHLHEGFKSGMWSPIKTIGR